MTKNMKFGLVLFLGVVLPLVFAIANQNFSNIEKFEWGYNHINSVSFFALFLGISYGVISLFLSFFVGKDYSVSFIILITLMIEIISACFIGSAIPFILYKFKFKKHFKLFDVYNLHCAGISFGFNILILKEICGSAFKSKIST